MLELQLIRRLGIPQDTLDAVMELQLPENHEQIKAMFLSNKSGFKTYASQDDNGLGILRLYLEWLPDIRERYNILGIPLCVFNDSIKDISIWCNDYILKNGKPGLAEWGWVGKTLRLEVFRLGRLQFAPNELCDNVSIDGRVFSKGTPILEVHIPAGEVLDTNQVLESLNWAPLFFNKYFNTQYALFHCYSWLLAPALNDLLQAKSRILQFQKLFSIYRIDHERQAEERVFGLVRDDIINYPERTSLQKNIKKYLLDGKSIGIGAGVRMI